MTEEVSATNVALKPCPFCGGEAEIKPNNIGDFFAMCSGCGASTSDIKCELEESAARRWNTRHGEN